MYQHTFQRAAARMSYQRSLNQTHIRRTRLTRVVDSEGFTSFVREHCPVRPTTSPRNNFRRPAPRNPPAYAHGNRSAGPVPSGGTSSHSPRRPSGSAAFVPPSGGGARFVPASPGRRLFVDSRGVAHRHFFNNPRPASGSAAFRAWPPFRPPRRPPSPTVIRRSSSGASAEAATIRTPPFVRVVSRGIAPSTPSEVAVPFYVDRNRLTQATHSLQWVKKSSIRRAAPSAVPVSPPGPSSPTVSAATSHTSEVSSVASSSYVQPGRSYASVVGSALPSESSSVSSGSSPAAEIKSSTTINRIFRCGDLSYRFVVVGGIVHPDDLENYLYRFSLGYYPFLTSQLYQIGVAQLTVCGNMIKYVLTNGVSNVVENGSYAAAYKCWLTREVSDDLNSTTNLNFGEGWCALKWFAMISHVENLPPAFAHWKRALGRWPTLDSAISLLRYEFPTWNVRRVFLPFTLVNADGGHVSRDSKCVELEGTSLMRVGGIKPKPRSHACGESPPSMPSALKALPVRRLSPMLGLCSRFSGRSFCPAVISKAIPAGANVATIIRILAKMYGRKIYGIRVNYRLVMDNVQFLYRRARGLSGSVREARLGDILVNHGDRFIHSDDFSPIGGLCYRSWFKSADMTLGNRKMHKVVATLGAYPTLGRVVKELEKAYKSDDFPRKFYFRVVGRVLSASDAWSNDHCDFFTLDARDSSFDRYFVGGPKDLPSSVSINVLNSDEVVNCHNRVSGILQRTDPSKSAFTKAVEFDMINEYNIVAQQSKNRGDIFIGYPIEDEHQSMLQMSFPEFHIRFVHSSYSDHPVAASVRLMYNHLFDSLYKDVGYIDIGGDLRYHINNGHGDVHVCTPLIDAKDASRAVIRKLSWKGEPKTPLVNLALASETKRTFCYKDASLCDVSKDVAVMVEVYDVPFIKACSIMSCRGISMLHLALCAPGELIDDHIKVIDVPHLSLRIEKVGDRVHYSYGAGVAYQHDIADIQSWMKATTMTIGDDHFFCELLGVRAGISEYRVTRSKNQVSSGTTKVISIPNAYQGHVLVKLPSLDDNLLVSKSKTAIRFVNCDFFMRCYVYGLKNCTQINEKNYEFMLTYMNNAMARSIISGKVVQSQCVMSPEDFAPMAALFLVVAVRKRHYNAMYARKVGFRVGELSVFSVISDVLKDKFKDSSKALSKRVLKFLKKHLKFLDVFDCMDLDEIYKVCDKYTVLRITDSATTPSSHLNVKDEIAEIESYVDRAYKRDLGDCANSAFLDVMKLATVMRSGSGDGAPAGSNKGIEEEGGLGGGSSESMTTLVAQLKALKYMGWRFYSLLEKLVTLPFSTFGEIRDYMIALIQNLRRSSNSVVNKLCKFIDLFLSQGYIFDLNAREKAYVTVSSLATHLLTALICVVTGTFSPTKALFFTLQTFFGSSLVKMVLGSNLNFSRFRASDDFNAFIDTFFLVTDALILWPSSGVVSVAYGVCTALGMTRWMVRKALLPVVGADSGFHGLMVCSDSPDCNIVRLIHFVKYVVSALTEFACSQVDAAMLAFRSTVSAGVADAQAAAKLCAMNQVDDILNSMRTCRDRALEIPKNASTTLCNNLSDVCASAMERVSRVSNWVASNSFQSSDIEVVDLVGTGDVVDVYQPPTPAEMAVLHSIINEDLDSLDDYKSACDGYSDTPGLGGGNLAVHASFLASLFSVGSKWKDLCLFIDMIKSSGSMVAKTLNKLVKVVVKKLIDFFTVDNEPDDSQIEEVGVDYSSRAVDIKDSCIRALENLPTNEFGSSSNRFIYLNFIRSRRESRRIICSERDARLILQEIVCVRRIQLGLPLHCDVFTDLSFVQLVDIFNSVVGDEPNILDRLTFAFYQYHALDCVREPWSVALCNLLCRLGSSFTTSYYNRQIGLIGYNSDRVIQLTTPPPGLSGGCSSDELISDCRRVMRFKLLRLKLYVSKMLCWGTNWICGLATYISVVRGVAGSAYHRRISVFGDELYFDGAEVRNYVVDLRDRGADKLEVVTAIIQAVFDDIETFGNTQCTAKVLLSGRRAVKIKRFFLRHLLAFFVEWHSIISVEEDPNDRELTFLERQFSAPSEICFFIFHHYYRTRGLKFAVDWFMSQGRGDETILPRVSGSENPSVVDLLLSLINGYYPRCDFSCDSSAVYLFAHTDYGHAGKLNGGSPAATFWRLQTLIETISTTVRSSPSVGRATQFLIKICNRVLRAVGLTYTTFGATLYYNKEISGPLVVVAEALKVILMGVTPESAAFFIYHHHGSIYKSARRSWGYVPVSIRRFLAMKTNRLVALFWDGDSETFPATNAGSVLEMLEELDDQSNNSNAESTVGSASNRQRVSLRKTVQSHVDACRQFKDGVAAMLKLHEVEARSMNPSVRKQFTGLLAQGVAEIARCSGTTMEPNLPYNEISNLIMSNSEWGDAGGDEEALLTSRKRKDAKADLSAAEDGVKVVDHKNKAKVHFDEPSSSQLRDSECAEDEFSTDSDNSDSILSPITALTEEKKGESGVKGVKSRAVGRRQTKTKVVTPGRREREEKCKYLLNIEGGNITPPSASVMGDSVYDKAIGEYVYMNKYAVFETFEDLSNKWKELVAYDFVAERVSYIREPGVYIFSTASRKPIGKPAKEAKLGDYEWGFVNGKLTKFNPSRLSLELIASKCIIVTEALKHFSSNQILAGMEKDCKEFTNTKLKAAIYESPPGGGKTQALVDVYVKFEKRVKVLVATANAHSPKDIATRVLKVTGKKVDDASVDAICRRVRTFDSLVINGMPDCDLLLVDKAFLVHAGQILHVINKTMCKAVVLFGDSKQIKFINRQRLLSLVHGDIDNFINRSNRFYTDVTYRCPHDTSLWLTAVYGRVITSKAPKNILSSMTMKLINSISDVTHNANCQYMVYTQGEKNDLLRELRSRDPDQHFNVNTVHECQGGTYDHVILVRTKVQDDSVFSSEAHNIVALSRHTESLEYDVAVSKAGDTTSENIKVAESMIKTLKQSNCDSLGEFYERYPEKLNFLDRKKIPVSSAPILTINDFLESVVPGSTTFEFGDMSKDMASSNVTSCVDNIRINTGVSPNVTGESTQFVSVIRSQAIPDRTPSWQENLYSFESRNFNCINVKSHMGCDRFGAFLGSATLTRAFNPDKLADLRGEIATLTTVGVKNFLSKRSETQIKDLLSECDKPLDFLDDITLFKLMVKREAKVKLDSSCMSKHSPAQNIIFHNKVVNLIFSPIFDTIKSRILYCLNPNILFYVDMNEEELAEWVYRRIGGEDIYYKAELDFSKFDKSQDFYIKAYERFMYQAFGFDPELLDIWMEGEYHCRAMSRDRDLAFTLSAQRRSGGSNTWIGNTLVTLGLLCMYYDLSKANAVLLSGDDSIIFHSREIPDTSEEIITDTGFETKFIRDAPAYFCSKFIVFCGDYVCFSPDPYKLCVRLGKTLNIRSYYELYERYISFRDVTRDYDDGVFIENLAPLVSRRYKCPLSEVYPALCSIHCARANFKKFREIYPRPSGYTLVRGYTHLILLLKHGYKVYEERKVAKELRSYVGFAVQMYLPDDDCQKLCDLTTLRAQHGRISYLNSSRGCKEKKMSKLEKRSARKLAVDVDYVSNRICAEYS
ncbi:ORF 1a/1b fusion polyprotein [Blueberry virus A]|uniref:ORF 1a/1b fusion polyprotein n=3 Tax=Blueberry virus A TaxID=1206566 RepID=J7M2S5_9CLOS|nr:ORF 1a/1b fusion polyprotein [Blueberry virus A]BAM37090.1 ORF 1a/1b fusion polyprotein [Blueberry virus A]